MENELLRLPLFEQQIPLPCFCAFGARLLRAAGCANQQASILD